VNISTAGIALIKQFEGCRLEAYLDSVGVPTIGYGSTEGVTMGDKITQDEADALLLEDLVRFEKCVNEHVDVPITQEQFDSLVCFAFNVGCGALIGSTLLKLLNAGNYNAAAQQFLRWDKAGGKVLAGLTRRRQAESDLFSKGIA
jgi:lysozyme